MFFSLPKFADLKKKVGFSFLTFWAFAYGARLLQLLQLYFCDTPSGGPFVERKVLGFVCAAIADAAAFAVLGGVYALGTFLKKNVARYYSIFVSLIATLYLLVCVINDQVMRWMGQHLNLSFLSTYSVSTLDPNLFFNIASEGLGNFLLSVLIMVIAIVLFVIQHKKGSACKSSRISVAVGLVFFALLAIACGNAQHYIKACHIRWQRIQPVYITILNDLQYQKKHSVKPENFEAGIVLLGGNPQEQYPFYHPVNDEAGLMNAFKSKDMSEKKDVILLSLESFRGWVGDFRIGKNCDRMPNLCRLSKAGTTFPYTYSVGYPSTEGMLGLQLGIWSHPNKVFLSNLMNVKARSLPDILGDAGYHRIVLSAAEPSFDNFSPWFEKWFDVHEYNPQVNTDIPLAERFKEMYENRPSDKPLYFEWINFVTHTPFNVPKSYAEPAATSDEKYGQAVAYLDSAIGIILRTIEKSPRANETIIVVTGDHSIANAKAQEKSDELGAANSTYTWTTFIWKGPGVPERASVVKPVSHVDYAPTVLSLLGIQASNNFVGRNLFGNTDENSFGSAVEDGRTTFTFRHDDAIMRRDSVAVFAQSGNESFAHARKQSQVVDWDTTETIGGFIAEQKISLDVRTEAKQLLDAMDSWVWILDKNLLSP